jgi:D-3-phosphoglycerate dehydrogenase
MTTYKVLFSAPYMIPFLDRFRPELEAHGLELIIPNVQERLSENEILAYAGEFDGAICGDDRYSERVLKACAPRLKVISKWGTGIDSIDLQAAQRLGIQVRNTPNAFTTAVADTVLGYLLAFARRQPWMDRGESRSMGENPRLYPKRTYAGCDWRGEYHRQGNRTPDMCFWDEGIWHGHHRDRPCLPDRDRTEMTALTNLLQL